MEYSEMRELARLIVQEQARNREWMTAYVKAQKAIDKKYLTVKEAAERLGISTWQLYRIKENFTYTKHGCEKSSHLRFDADTLVEEYEAYLVGKRTEQMKVAL